MPGGPEIRLAADKEALAISRRSYRTRGVTAPPERAKAVCMSWLPIVSSFKDVEIDETPIQTSIRRDGSAVQLAHS